MTTDYDTLIEGEEFRKLLAVETLLAEAPELIARLMAEGSVTKAELARRLNTSRAWVTQLLNGRTNMTIRTLSEVAYALGNEIKIDARPVEQVKPPVARGRRRPVSHDRSALPFSPRRVAQQKSRPR